MKLRNKLLFVSILPLCLSASPHKKNFEFYSTNVLSKLTGDSNATLDLFIKPVVSGNYQVVSRLYNNAHNNLLFSNTFNEGVTSSGTSFSVEYPLRYKLTGDGLRFDFEITFLNRVTTYSGLLYPFTNQVINVSNYKDSVYTTENRFIKVETNQVVTGESFSFADYNEYLSKKSDNTIDFSTIKFKYLNDYSFKYLKAEYHIKDYKNVYPHLKKTNGEIVLDMICIPNNGEISFSLLQIMYVNKDTLDMSNIKLPNYVITSDLYVPIGKQSLLEENDSYILIKEAGYSAVDLMFPLTFYLSKPMLGLCHDSDYCIAGGVRE